MKKNGRLNQLEYIDLGQYTPEEYRDCLYQLDRVGRFLGGDHANYWAFNQLKKPPQSILDFGCGGGLFTMRLAKRYPQAQILGVDITPEAIQFANESLQQIDPPLTNVKFFVPSSPQLEYPPKSFDVITSTLVCHHLSDDEIVSFLKKGYSIARQAIILNDLHRHFLATLGFTTLIPFLFRNRLVTHDGLISIRRAFTRQDWYAYIQAADIPITHCSITWHWAFRWIVLIHILPSAKS